tara:strand:- start:1383 stop:1562 length:180 start_codon:yes stop_codon:yes gene_type:complete
METPEIKSVKPELDLPITAGEASQLLDGQEFTWQLEFENGKKTTVHVYLDKYGSYLEKQ